MNLLLSDAALTIIPEAKKTTAPLYRMNSTADVTAKNTDCAAQHTYKLPSILFHNVL